MAVAIILFVGALMPGAWRLSISLLAPAFPLMKVGHVLAFACLAFLLPRNGVIPVNPIQVVALGVALAVLTELLQLLAVDRNPSLGDVALDTLGTVLGVCLYRAAGLDRGRLHSRKTQPVPMRGSA